MSSIENIITIGGKLYYRGTRYLYNGSEYRLVGWDAQNVFLYGSKVGVSLISHTEFTQLEEIRLHIGFPYKAVAILIISMAILYVLS